MKLLAEILGMTNYCNLRCTYCEWQMKPTIRLDDAAYAAADANIRKVGELVRKHYPTVEIVEYSGGEPFVYPGIIHSLLDTFPDKWLRVSTNGTLIDAPMIARLAKSKSYMCLSLDGSTFEANAARFRKNLKIFNTANDTIGALLSAGVPVLILCTLNTTNIDNFPDWVKTLSERYPNEIASGLLTMPAHCVSEYNRDNGKPTVEQVIRFVEYIGTRARAYPLVASIYEHYQRVAAFLGVSTYKLYAESGRLHELPERFRAHWANAHYERTCFLYDWQVNFHFLDDAISKPDGVFKSWGCGMRAVEDLGDHSVHASATTARHLPLLESPEVNPLYRSELPLGDRCSLLKDCFVDWNVFDMIFSGEIPIERAQKWNVMFRDPNLAAAIEQSSRKYRPMVKRFSLAG